MLQPCSHSIEIALWICEISIFLKTRYPKIKTKRLFQTLCCLWVQWNGGWRILNCNMALARHKAASKLEIKVALDIMCQCRLSIVGDAAHIHFWRLSTFSTVGDWWGFGSQTPFVLQKVHKMRRSSSQFGQKEFLSLGLPVESCKAYAQ